ncbi:MAG: NAD(P)/FAD-dependent oxidoreductase [Nitrospinae bacterium]|nr:NAD(P)/FAD-dependent oxidoreductase [Nitrospinota bacterium]
MKKLLILGAGTGGTLLANLLSRKLPHKEWEITVIDKSPEHHYQPGYLFLPFKLYGYNAKEDIVRPVREPLPHSAKFVQADVYLIDHKNRAVHTSAGNFDYDWLILGLGCRIAPEEVEGLEDAMNKNAHTFYTLEGALKMQEALENFQEGHLVLNIADMPIKCPVAPIEFVFLADYYFHLKNIRDRVQISLVTPLTGAFTKPVANETLHRVMDEKNIKVVPNFALESVDADNKVIKSYTGETVSYDLLCSIPPNLGPQVIEESGLGDGIGYAVTEDKTLKSKRAENTYVVGDCSNVHTSKAGSVTHFEAEIVSENLLREIAGKEPHPDYDGHSNCFIETGFHKAFLIDFNYDIEPVHGTFPIPGIGPMSLLENTYLNHWGKMAFKWVYWNLMLTGRLPGDPLLPIRMSMSGKKLDEIKQHGGH